jgi:hypothetical protein
VPRDAQERFRAVVAAADGLLAVTAQAFERAAA